MRLLSIMLAFFVGLLAMSPAWATWQLNNDHSTLSFVSIKKGNIAEVHHFNKVAGIVEGDHVVFTADLASVDTNIAIRDQRMKEFLFEVSQPGFAQAQFKAALTPNVLKEMNAGELKTLALQGELSLHGEKQTVNVQVLVVKLADNKVIISSLKPIIINAENYALVDGIAKLQALAGLPSISNAVPVSFVLVFERN